MSDPTILNYLKQLAGLPTVPQDPNASLYEPQIPGLPQNAGSNASPGDPSQTQSMTAPQMALPPIAQPVSPVNPGLGATDASVGAPSAPPTGLWDKIQAGLSDPGIARMLLSGGAALMAAGGPSDKPVSLGQGLASSINQGGNAFDQYRQTQLTQAAQKQAMGANQWQTLSPDDTKKAIPGGVAPGFIAQRNANGEIRLVGQDVMKSATGYDANGYPITYPVDVRKAGTGAPAGGPGAAGSNTQKIAHLIATYQMAPLSSFALKTPSGQAIMAAVSTENPQYNANNFTEYQKGFKDFGTGKQGTQVKSFGVAMSHLNTLDNLTDALDNGNVQLLNKAANFWKSQTGQTAPTSFNAAKDVVSQEIIKAVTGASGALGDRESAQKTLDAANSPAQLKQVIQTYKQLMAGQLQGLQRQFESSTGRTDFTDAMKLPPDVVQLLGGPAQGAGSSGGWSITPVP